MTAKKAKIQIVTLTEKNLGKVRMFCGRSPGYRRGYEAKQEWVRARLAEGMRYTLLQVDGRNAGLLEAIPGEYAWRGVEAAGYLFIHCFWVIGSNRRHGYGRQLLQRCLKQAEGSHGVAVITSKDHWLPTRKIFLKNGFEVVDQAPPSFELLARRFSAEAPLPRFAQITPAQKIKMKGLTLITSDQCPYFHKTADMVIEAGALLNIPVNVIHVESAREAQSLPGVYGTMGILYNGERLTYHPLSGKKLLELLEPRLAK